MNADWQTWVALGIVALAVVLLMRRAFARRGGHDGCGCPGVDAGRELKALKRRMRR